MKRSGDSLDGGTMKKAAGSSGAAACAGAVGGSGTKAFGALNLIKRCTIVAALLTSLAQPLVMMTACKDFYNDPVMLYTMSRMPQAFDMVLYAAMKRNIDRLKLLLAAGFDLSKYIPDNDSMSYPDPKCAYISAVWTSVIDASVGPEKPDSFEACAFLRLNGGVTKANISDCMAAFFWSGIECSATCIKSAETYAREKAERFKDYDCESEDAFLEAEAKIEDQRVLECNCCADYDKYMLLEFSALVDLAVRFVAEDPSCAKIVFTDKPILACMSTSTWYEGYKVYVRGLNLSRCIKIDHPAQNFDVFEPSHGHDFLANAFLDSFRLIGMRGNSVCLDRQAERLKIVEHMCSVINKTPERYNVGLNSSLMCAAAAAGLYDIVTKLAEHGDVYFRGTSDDGQYVMDILLEHRYSAFVSSNSNSISVFDPAHLAQNPGKFDDIDQALLSCIGRINVDDIVKPFTLSHFFLFSLESMKALTEKRITPDFIKAAYESGGWTYMINGPCNMVIQDRETLSKWSFLIETYGLECFTSAPHCSVLELAVSCYAFHREFAVRAATLAQRIFCSFLLSL
jgi:hypothetical protein